jgi:hypothetical protein
VDRLLEAANSGVDVLLCIAFLILKQAAGWAQGTDVPLRGSASDADPEALPARHTRSSRRIERDNAKQGSNAATTALAVPRCEEAAHGAGRANSAAQFSKVPSSTATSALGLKRRQPHVCAARAADRSPLVRRLARALP